MKEFLRIILAISVNLGLVVGFVAVASYLISGEDNAGAIQGLTMIAYPAVAIALSMMIAFVIGSTVFRGKKRKQKSRWILFPAFLILTIPISFLASVCTLQLIGFQIWREDLLWVANSVGLGWIVNLFGIPAFLVWRAGGRSIEQVAAGNVR